MVNLLHFANFSWEFYLYRVINPLFRFFFFGGWGGGGVLTFCHGCDWCFALSSCLKMTSRMIFDTHPKLRNTSTLKV